MSPNHFPWLPNSYLCMVGIVTSEGNSYSWIFNHNHVGIKPQKRMVEEIKEVLSKANKIIGHNLKFDMHWLSSIGIEFPTNKIWDTMIVEYLLNGQNNRLSYSLDESCKRRGLETKYDAVKAYWDSGIDTKDIPIDTLVEYCIRDCKVTLDLYTVQESIIPSEMRRLVKLQNSFVQCLQEIESNGMVVDNDFLVEQINIYTKRQEELNEKLSYFIVDNVPELRDIPYSLTSNDHLSAILFGGVIKYDSTEFVTRTYLKSPPKTYERNCTKEVYIKGLGFKPKEENKTKKEGYYKTNKDILSSLPARNKVTTEFLKIIREQADVSKILGTYLLGIQKLMSTTTNKVHPPFNQALTVTGRLSSFFQTLPRGSTPETVVVKRSFIPRGKDRVILNGDLSSLEWNVASQLSGDKVMIQEIIDGVDPHLMNSVQCFGSEDFRQEAKVVSFRSIYGGSAFAFFKDPKMPKRPLAEWEQIHGRFYDKYRGLGQWQNDLYKEVCATGTYQAFTGRKWVFHKEPDYAGVLKYSKPAVCNYQVQGVSTGDIVPFAIMVIRRKILDRKLDAFIICQVHDSIVLDVSIKDADEVAQIIWETFNELPKRITKYFGYDFYVPLTGEVEVGKTYKDLKKIFGKRGRIAYTSEVF